MKGDLKFKNIIAYSMVLFTPTTKKIINITSDLSLFLDPI